LTWHNLDISELSETNVLLLFKTKSELTGRGRLSGCLTGAVFFSLA